MKVFIVAGNTVLHINETAPVRFHVKVEDVRIQLDDTISAHPSLLIC